MWVRVERAAVKHQRPHRPRRTDATGAASRTGLTVSASCRTASRNMPDSTDRAVFAAPGPEFAVIAVSIRSTVGVRTSHTQAPRSRELGGNYVVLDGIGGPAVGGQLVQSAVGEHRDRRVRADVRVAACHPIAQRELQRSFGGRLGRPELRHLAHDAVVVSKVRPRADSGRRSVHDGEADPAVGADRQRGSRHPTDGTLKTVRFLYATTDEPAVNV